MRINDNDRAKQQRAFIDKLVGERLEEGTTGSGAADEPGRPNKSAGGKGAQAKAKVGAGAGHGPIDASVGAGAVMTPGGAIGSGGGDSVLPAGTAPDGNPASGALAAETGEVAATLPITNRVATTEASAEFSAVASPLSNAIDKLSDTLASGTATDAQIAQDIDAVGAAMKDAGLEAQVPQAMQTMIDRAGLTGPAAAHVQGLVAAAGHDMAQVAPQTLDEAKAQLAADVANPDADPGKVALGVQAVQNAARAAEAAGTPGAAAEADAAIDDIVAQHADSDGASSGLAALYAAAAKNGVDITDKGDDAMSKAMSKKVGNSKKAAADVKAKEHREWQAAEQAKQQQQQQQQYRPQQQSGGGGSHDAGGGTGSATGAGTTSSAGVYDPVAATNGHGTADNLEKYKQNEVAPGTYNFEEQRYTSGDQNVSFKPDGTATITARREQDGSLTSAKLTGDKLGALPVYIEATMTERAGDGTWPAFWLCSDGSWPQGGEIDVREHVNGDSNNTFSSHWGPDTPPPGEMPPFSPNFNMTDIDPTVPHTYGVAINEAGQIQFYLDGKKAGDPQEWPPGSNPQQLVPEMRPTVNIALGGTWPNDVPGNFKEASIDVQIRRSKTPPDA